MNENEFRIKGTDVNVTNAIFERYKNEVSYISILKYDVLTNNNDINDFIDEFNSKIKLFTEYNILLEIDQYKWLFELSDYAWDGNQFVKDRIELYEIEKSLIKNCHIKIIHKKTFEIWKFLEKQLIKIKEPQQSKSNNNENMIWFKVGLLFATGEMNNLITKFNSNATQIAKDLQNINYRPYITESISKRHNNDKNIFSNRLKMQSIIDYCNLHNIEVKDEFASHLPIE